jgi:thioredoxin-related protein
MNPVVDGLRQAYEGQVTFTLVDIDEPDSKELKQKYNFRAQPYFVLLDGEGNVVQTWFGIVPVETFEDAFNTLTSG